MLEDGCVLKCRRCRSSLVNGRCVVGSHGGGDSCPMEGLSTLWYISDNNIPDWIQDQIIQVHWTKGRLLCPKCGGRLGSFDFVSLVKCPCGDQVFPPIHIQRCRVDVDKVSPKHIPKTQQGEKLPLKMCETKEQACGIVSPEHLAGGQLADKHYEKPKKNRKTDVATVGTGDAPVGTGVSVRTGVLPARTVVTPAKTRLSVAPARKVVTPGGTSVVPAGTGDAPARSNTAPADTGASYVADDGVAETDSSVSDMAESTSSTIDEEESEGDQTTRTAASWQRPLVVTDGDDSCIHDTNLFQVLEGLDGGNTGHTADRRRIKRQTKRERNKLKNIRKKQRRHEKWVKKQTQEVEQFEEAEREGLICPVCLDLYYEPYMCQPCGHVFCDPCLRQVAKDDPGCTACPLCRTVVITVNYSYQLSKTMQEFFPRHHESRRRAERQTQYKSWPLPGVTGARALWWTTVTSLTSRRGGRNYPHYRSNDDDLNYDGSMFDELLVYFYSINWIIGLFVVCGLCYFTIRSFIF
ncbi:E3 ubiquitin-protein ligase RNF180-like [Branchiostoma floridae]|uniref:E3 ubiquitin-protein ligase RNF180-like n=1 Tax=Branchiostoma floridae TaxID=7739 RepID=A0A9J7KWB8_BRAFL|nr:E3 ubiquitin-protein ligase RNF180-like [Branchiostoma floridae]XP_035670959.1 E3 ubiquitin-protein ligase RNF180-like [Branchiostoma floridae]